MKSEFEMKDLGKTKFFLGLQLEDVADGIFVHQSNYTQKVLERFGFDKSFPAKTPWSEDHYKQIKIPIYLEKRGRKYWDRNSHT